MNQRIKNGHIFAAILALSFSAASAAPGWNLLGLSDRSVNCILADDTTMILAGTSKGMSVYWQHGWHDFNLTLPVTSITRLSRDLIAVGAGNGSRSDAVYLGRYILRGPPFYVLRFQTWCITPTAMALGMPMAIDRLYVGSARQGISVFMIGSDTLIFERSLKIPDYAFGVEAPRCAALTWFDGSHFFAGGYGRSPLPGPGNLLALASDSMRILKKLNVTALAKGSFFETAPRELVIGTVDSGVLLHNPANNEWTSLSRPAREPVNDVVVLRPMIGWSDLLLCATNSGVYTNSGRSTTWTALGKILKAPLCLAGRGNYINGYAGNVLAGTAEGVYIYSQTVGTRNGWNPVDVFANNKPIAGINGRVTIPLQWNNGKTVSITVYSVAGRIAKREATSRNSISLKLPAGIFRYRCFVAGKADISGVIVNY